VLTDTLIATVLGLPLSVRLRLLNADPTGHGTECDQFGREQASARASEIPHDCLVSSVTRGGAWLPANPLTVIEIAARIFGKRHGLTPSIELLGPDETDGWTCRIVVAGNVSVMAAGGRDEIGVLTLREVCRV